jgi:hypothetical protein
MKIEITQQQAIELEMLLQAVHNFGVQAKGVELGLYSEAFASLHEQIKAQLNDKLKQQSANSTY